MEKESFSSPSAPSIPKPKDIDLLARERKYFFDAGKSLRLHLARFDERWNIYTLPANYRFNVEDLIRRFKQEWAKKSKQIWSLSDPMLVFAQTQEVEAWINDLETDDGRRLVFPIPEERYYFGEKF